MKPQKWNSYFRPVRIAWWASHLMHHTPAGLQQDGCIYTVATSCTLPLVAYKYFRQQMETAAWLIFWVSHSVLMTTGLSSFVLIKADRRLSSFKKENY